MLHVFNGPIEPTSLAEFQESKKKATLFTCKNNKRKVDYLKDGRRFIDGKIENKQSASSLWSTVLARSVAQDLKARSQKDLNSNNLGYMRQYMHYLSQKLTQQRNIRIMCTLIAVNIILIVFFMYFFVL
ncbi:unnamed protein product [Thelazia callipaeda]|uniref:Vesicle transport protein USE1 n=1 Tax=Thelazia callipaeda TaxID=103827 RepID=A0A0N5D5A0_THECL|nr:unnamed protein product [Thelazia callipaeda]